MTQQRFKPFFFHHDVLKGVRRAALNNMSAEMRHRPRGVTVFVQPNEHPHKIDVQTALCSPKDGFSKKVGRDTALSHPVVTINARELPKFLGEQVVKTTWGYGNEQQFHYMLKYVI